MEYWQTEIVEKKPALVNTYTYNGERFLRRAARRLYLRGELCSYEEGLTSELIEDFDILSMQDGNGEWISLHLQTIGGDVHAGLEIIKAIKRAQAKGWKVRGVVDGVAMSMGFIILQFCDERVMGRGDIVMAHGITISVFGKDQKDLKLDASLLEYWKQYFVEQIVSRKTAGLSVEKKDEETARWDIIMEDSTHALFTTEQAMEECLIDRID